MKTMSQRRRHQRGTLDITSRVNCREIGGQRPGNQLVRRRGEFCSPFAVQFEARTVSFIL